MKHPMAKLARFAWRLGRNFLCVSPWGRSLLFSSESLANRFGPGDADYAIRVFMHHYQQLSAAGFPYANKILEVGPGQNLGTSLLMWALNYRRAEKMVTVVLWDAYPNIRVDSEMFRETARALLGSASWCDLSDALPDEGIDHILSMVAQGELRPDIRYRVQTLSNLNDAEAGDMGLIYSQAAIEHIWNISEFWPMIIGLTRPGGWHSHRIDLADHGRRETNYVEMLEWSRLGYWLTMRFVPGAINRWRASMHMTFLAQAGLEILSVSREIRETLPITIGRLNRAFRSLEESDLRTTALDIVGVKLV